jgi:hypothetical protein
VAVGVEVLEMLLAAQTVLMAVLELFAFAAYLLLQHQPLRVLQQ